MHGFAYGPSSLTAYEWYGRPTERDIQRFESKFTRSDGCWEWTGGRNPRNYGVFSLIFGRSLNASRASWLIYRGDIPPYTEVCHSCDHGWCVNPDHLFLATHEENMRDARRKGRMGGPVAGIDKAVLRELLANGMTHSAAARHFGVSVTSVQSAARLLQKHDRLL